MAITESIGYDGSVDETAWARLAPTLGAEYGVLGPDDWKVTIKAGADRTVIINTGGGWGHGVLDFNTATVEKAHDVVASGTRIDMIVARRNWNGTNGSTTYEIIKGGSTFGLLPARNTTPGDIDDQPIALVELAAGQTQPVRVVDLRVWQANGGACAQDGHVLQYLTRVGTQVRIANTYNYQRVLNPQGQPTWLRQDLDALNLFGFGRPQSNYAQPIVGTPQFYFQAGAIQQSTGPTAHARITFPKPFPTGLLAVFFTNADDTMGNMVSAHIDSSGVYGPGTNTSVVYRLWGPSGGGSTFVPLTAFAHRLNYLAVGW